MKHWNKIRHLGLFCCLGVCIGMVVLQQRTPTILPVASCVVVLDAGHGGWDPGKTGSSGADEQELNLAIVQQLQAYLEQGGATVYLTRSDGMALGNSKGEDMRQRRDITNIAQADILISIHQNAFSASSAKGAQVFYHTQSEEGERLATCIQESLRLRVDSQNTRKQKPNSDYYILRTTEIPAALVECGFLSNQTEETLLNDPEYQAKMAWGIYCGILDYFAQKGGANGLQA